MKVLHLISGGDTGGAKTSVLTLLKQLKKLVGIRLICLIDADFYHEAKELGIDTILLPQKNRFDLSVVGVLGKMIRDEQFDLINCHGARANFIGAFLKKQVNCPFVTTMHSDYTHDFDNNLYKKVVFTFLNKRSLKKMDAFICMAEQLRAELVEKDFPTNQLFVAYNGVPMSVKPAMISPEDFANKYGFPWCETNHYVGIAARLHPIKGLDIFIKAAQRLEKEFPHIKFLIAGDGEEKYTKLYQGMVKERGLEDTVYFLGFVKEMDDFYRLISINTITSHSEGFCYALLEGGKHKKPTIASRVGGIPELIDTNENGYLFEDCDDEAFASLIRKVFLEPTISQQLGNALFEKIKGRFSDEAMAKSYQEIYKRVLER